MDPATALGIAAAAVQFIEVGLKTLALCKQIRDSDTDTTALHVELQQSTKQLESLQRGVTLNVFPRDTSRAIKQCTQDCSSAAGELRDLLSEIQAIAQKKRFGVARAAFRALKDQKKVEKLQNKLEKCQARFQAAVSVDTREQVLALLQSQGKMGQTLEDVVYPELKRMHVVTQAQISDFRADSTAAHEATRKALANLDTTSKASGKAIRGIGAEVKHCFDHAQTSHTYQLFLKSLEYPEMFSRHRHIQQPTSGTFEWIFARSSTHTYIDPKTMELQGRFSKWLRSSQPVFWVNGKAGSGKSSLMSFIEGHNRRNDLLRIWAGGRKLHVFSFFFWRAGSEMQKSIPGLLQSLLYQLAQAKPSIVSDLMLSDQSAGNSTWTERRLERAVEQALSLFREDRIFLLIDGLDEFEGKYMALVTLLLRMQDRSAAKLCLSSRPETALVRQLSSYPSLRLQDLNQQDIEDFVHSELETCAHVFEKPKNFTSIISEVAARAEGIFLWAVLVCKSLVSGYEAMDDAEMLQQRLEAVPSGLEDLFAYMFSNIEKEHRESLARCFFLLKWGQYSGHYVTLPLMTAFLRKSPHKSLTDFRKDCDVVAHRVMAQGKGLLEVCKPASWRTRGIEKYVSKVGLCVLKDVTSGTVCYRSVERDDADFVLERTTSRLDWVHRSAYDCILGDSRDRQESWTASWDEQELLLDLLNAMLWIACYFPSRHINAIDGPTARIAGLIETHSERMMEDGFQALDELYETIQAAYYQTSCVDSKRGFSIGTKHYLIHTEGAPLRAFWIALTYNSLDDYLLARFDRITGSVHANLICSGLLMVFRQRRVTSDRASMLQAMTLCFDFLINKVPPGNLILAARTAGGDHYPGHRRYDRRCVSWVGNGGDGERRLVSDVGYSKVSYDSYSQDAVKRYPRQNRRTIENDLQRLSALWQIHWGEKFGGESSSPLQIHVPGPMPDLVAHQRVPDGHQSLHSWRFLCFGRSQDSERQFTMGECLPILACFESRAKPNQDLTRRFGRIDGWQWARRPISFVGTPEEEALCLRSIVEEIWADVEGQLTDGWQQLYLLGCLKRYFGTFWRRSEDFDTDTDSDGEGVTSGDETSVDSV